MSKQIKVTHLTSVHPRYDTRIFIKECTSLAKVGYNTTLVVADGNGNEHKNGVKIIDVGERSGNRIVRMTKTVKLVYRAAIALDSDIYHIHDPELIKLGVTLGKKGKKVIFDSHEDVTKDILSKEWIPSLFRGGISFAYGIYEKYTLTKFSGIITATPFIRDKFTIINENTVDINNFPTLSEFSSIESSQRLKEKSVCYVGGLSKVRGIKEIVQAMEYVQSNTTLKIAGAFSESAFEAEVKSQSGWQSVQELGFLDRQGIQNTLSSSVAGLVTLHPIINYQDALPVKMFEYMAAGLPVISSDIPLWKDIVDGNHCGICVDPMNPKAIADAIDYVATHSKEAQKMGENGKKAVLEKYNWDIEEKKLLSFYKSIMK